MEQEKAKLGIWRIVGLVLAGAIPFLLFAAGVLALFYGSILTVSYALTFLVLPCAIFVGCFFSIRSEQHPIVKLLICIGLLVLLFIVFGVLMAFGHYSIYYSETGEEAAVHYQEAVGDRYPMPKLDELARTETIEYHYFYNQVVTFFDSECYVLFCKYDPETYAEEKLSLKQRYNFQLEPPEAHGYEVSAVTEIDGYTFRFLSFEHSSYSLLYPKYMMLVGTNDETEEIVYLYYIDDDLDYIDSIEEQFRNDFGWEYMR